MTEKLKDKILRTLIESHQIRKEDLDEAVVIQKKNNKSLDKVLIDLGLIKEKDLAILLVKELNIPYINLTKYKIDPALKEIISERLARQYHIIPISSLEYTLTIALSDPLNVFIIDDIQNITGKEIDIVLSTNSEIIKAIDAYYGSSSTASMTEISKDIEVDGLEIITEQDSQMDTEGVVDESEKAPIIRMVNLIVKEAIRQRASDIHIEPTLEGMRVRYRIDGVLHDILKIPRENQNAVIVRIKIMARLDITAHQVPQDGRFKLKLSGKEIDFRVSLLPTTFGQKIVMRVLDKANLSVGLSAIGFSEHAMKLMSEATRKPFGMFLVTGPTGSGKSTTLYSIINELNTIDKHIMSIEDPVEYLVEGLAQIQAKPEIGLTFAEGLRSILRQSPDIVLVGEIRDNETADIAIKAALTGQLVFSTIHTNDAAGALTRLVDMGVEPFLVASSLVLVTAQRLCRKICPKCKAELDMPKKIFDEIKYDIKPETKFYFGKGCDACQKSGYHGRVGICEVMDIDDEIRNMLILGKSSDEIKAYARAKKGMVTLWEDAMLKCIAGITTYEEVLRVTKSD